MLSLKKDCGSELVIKDLCSLTILRRADSAPNSSKKSSLHLPNTSTIALSNLFPISKLYQVDDKIAPLNFA